jgi:ABC-type multidrug transport system permease subunit
MRYIRLLIPYLDDILLSCALVSFIVASYLVNAVLGTYVLGIAFLVAAFFAGVALRSPVVQQVIGKFQRRK